MTMSFTVLHNAVRTIEQSGLDGFPSVEKMVGTPAALALLITHLRKNVTIVDPHIESDKVDRWVIEFLQKHLPPGLTRSFEQPHAAFYTGRWYIFDNFSSFAILWRGVLWPTVEHAYQAAKFKDQAIIDRIRTAGSPYEAKRIAHEPDVASKKRKYWDKVKVCVMRHLIRLKADQHQYVMKRLLKSKDLILIEDSATDSFWGRGRDWLGDNTLGELWMEYREELMSGV